MTSERWRKIEELYRAALVLPKSPAALPPSQRLFQNVGEGHLEPFRPQHAVGYFGPVARRGMEGLAGARVDNPAHRHAHGKIFPDFLPHFGELVPPGLKKQ